MDYLKIWTSFRELLKPLEDDERGRLFTAMLEYAETGEEPNLTGNERYVWPAARQGINATREKSEQMRANASRPEQTGANASRPEQTGANRSKRERTRANASRQEQTGAKPSSPFDKDKVKVNIDDDDTARAREDSVIGSVPVDPLIVKVQQELNGLTDTHYAALDDYRRDLGDDLVSYAIDLAVGNGTRNWNYVEAILRGWVTLHIHTIGEAKAEHERRKTQPPPSSRPGKTVSAQQYQQRDYSEAELAQSLGVDDLFK